MGQAEVLKILKKVEWIASTELSKKSNLSIRSVNNALVKLIKQGLIERRKYRQGSGYEWRLK